MNASQRLDAHSAPPNRYPGTGSRGSVLVFVLILVGSLALLGTAFVVFVRVESRAATNSLRGLQAEAACQVGLAQAIYQIENTWQNCYRLDSAGGWHGYFLDTSAGAPDLCPDTWVQHYDETQEGRQMTARKYTLERVDEHPASSGTVKHLKRTRGFKSEYFIAVADLDGKLRVNPSKWDTLISSDSNKLKSMNRTWLDSIEPFASDSARAEAVAASLATHNTQIWSLGRLRPDLGLASVAEASAIESFMTVYPRKLSDLVPPTDRPAVNVNTARRKTLEAIVLNVPGLTMKAAAVAQKLVTHRPYPDRKAMESALDDLAPSPVGDGTLTEQQFNDLLNSLAGANSEAASDYDRPGDPSGVYEYDFDPNPPGSPPAVTGGVRTVAHPATGTAADTWGTEVKFTSRFFHIYVLGRTVADIEPRTLSERRLHAVYDALRRKVLWQRWNFDTRANMGD